MNLIHINYVKLLNMNLRRIVWLMMQKQILRKNSLKYYLTAPYKIKEPVLPFNKKNNALFLKKNTILSGDHSPFFMAKRLPDN